MQRGIQACLGHADLLVMQADPDTAYEPHLRRLQAIIVSHCCGLCICAHQTALAITSMQDAMYSSLLIHIISIL